MNVLDAALQTQTPAVMVPRYEALTPLDRSGHRYLVAADGMWIEVRREWCHLIWPVATHELPFPLPYGKLQKKVSLAFKELPTALIEAFVTVARAAAPKEVAATIMWHGPSSSFRLAPCKPISHGVGYIKAHWPKPREGESLVIDMHSHGPIPAYFSQEDRRDMGAEVVLALVVGALDKTKPQIALSLFAGGVEIPVTIPKAMRGSCAAKSDLEAAQACVT